MMLKYAIALAIVLVLAAFSRGRSCPPATCPATAPATCGSGCTCGCTPARASPTPSACGCAGAAWPRCAAPAASARPSRCGTGSPNPRQHSVFLGRAHYRHRLRVPLEEHLLVMAPPRTYKTAFLADVILRYPGPVIATTTKADIYALTAAVRAGLGPVHVFNPQHIGGVPSTFRWSPVDGCQDPATAIRRADAFAFAVSQQRRRRRHLLVRQSQRLPARLLPRRRPGRLRPAHRRRLGLRRRTATSPSGILNAVGARQWALTLAELRSEAHKTTATVRMVMSRALSFMADPALAACVLPAPGEGFDIPAFLADRGTVYLIAEAVSEEAPVAPLFAAMATEIHYIAAQLGQASEAGPAGPAAADGPGRGHPDLPGPAAALAVGLRRQGHPGRRRRPRRSPAGRPLGRSRPPGRPGHLLGEGVPARHHRHHHLAGGQHPVRAGLLEGPRPGPRHPPRRRHPGHDPPAARRVRPGHPRRLRPRHRPAAPRLEEPRLPPRPPPRPGPGRHLRRDRPLPGAPGPEPDIPDHVPADWIPGSGTDFPWS